MDNKRTASFLWQLKIVLTVFISFVSCAGMYGESSSFLMFSTLPERNQLAMQQSSACQLLVTQTHGASGSDRLLWLKEDFQSSFDLIPESTAEALGTLTRHFTENKEARGAFSTLSLTVLLRHFFSLFSLFLNQFVSSITGMFLSGRVSSV